MKTIGLCKKIGYATKTRARKVQTIQNHNTGKKLYIYKCPKCKFYHLTKMAQGKNKRV